MCRQGRTSRCSSWLGNLLGHSQCLSHPAVDRHEYNLYSLSLAVADYRNQPSRNSVKNPDWQWCTKIGLLANLKFSKTPIMHHWFLRYRSTMYLCFCIWSHACSHQGPYLCPVINPGDIGFIEAVTRLCFSLEARLKTWNTCPGLYSKP